MKKDVCVIVGAYVLVAGLWILFSDALVSFVFKGSVMVTRVSIYKGWFFVLVTGTMLYGLISRQVMRLQAALKEKDSLLYELNHRVNNNLQLIANLIDLQRRRIGGREASELLNDLRDRIRSIALAQDKLYLSKGISEVNLQAYVADLAKSIFFSYGAEKRGLRLKLEIDDFPLEIGRAVSVGLIINEIVTNSLKYAFPEKAGEVFISLKSLDNATAKLEVRDNGAGLSSGIDPAAAKSLGMQLIYGLAEKQLDGKIELERGKGTAYTIIFRKRYGG